MPVIAFNVVMLAFSQVLEPVLGKVLAVAEHAIHFTFRLKCNFIRVIILQKIVFFVVQKPLPLVASHEGNEETAVLTPGRSYISGSTNLLSQAPTRSILK